MATSLRELVVSVTADTRKYQSEMQRASQSTSQLYRGVQQGAPGATRAWEGQTNAARDHANAIEASKQAITRYIGVAAGAFSVGKLVGMADEWNQLNARVRLATGSTEEFQMTQERLGEIASRTYRRYSEAAEQFAQTVRPMRELGFETRATLDAAEALGLALVAGGSNAQRGQAAMDAWAKSIVQGRIDGEKFETLLLQTPRVAQALADALGKTTGELMEMARAGELAAGVAVPALVSQMAILRKEADALPVSVQDASNRLLDGLQEWAGGADEATGATKLLIGGMELLGGNIETVANLAAAGAIGVFGSKLALTSVDAVKAAQGMMQARTAQVALTASRVADAREAVVAATIEARDSAARKQFYAEMKANAVGKTELAYATRRYEVAAERAAMATQAQRASVQSLTAAETAASASTSRLAAAKSMMLGVMGGPAGLAITIGLVAAGMLTLGSNSNTADAELVNFNGTLQETVEQFRKLNTEQQAGRLLKLDEEITESTRAVERAIERMVAAASAFGSNDVLAPYLTQIRELQGEFGAGRISADEFSERVAALNRQVLQGSPAAQAVSGDFIRFGESLANSAREADRKRGIMGTLTQTQGELAAATGNATTVIGQQGQAINAMATAAEAAGQRIRNAIQTLPGQIARLGKSPGDVARMDVADWASAAGSLSEQFNRELQGFDYIQLVEQQDARQKALAASTRSVADATRAANKEKSDAEKAADRLLEQYEDMAASQRREITLYGEVGRAAGIAYDIANGALAEFEPKQQQILIAGAKKLDQLDRERKLQEDIARITAGSLALQQRYATPAETKRRGVYDDRTSAMDALLNGDIDTDGYDELMRRIEERAKTATDTMSTYADQAARNMQSHFADFLFDPFEGGTKGMVQGFSDALRRMAAEAAASRLFETVGGAMAGYGGQGTWGNIVRGIGGVLTQPKEAATGGLITGPGTGTSDSIPAYLSNGEYVINAAAVRKLGTGFLDAMNGAQRFAGGGLVGLGTNENGPERIERRAMTVDFNTSNKEFACLL